MPQQQTFEFTKMMTRYGIWLGFLIGSVAAIPIALMWFNIRILLPVLALIVVITMCGGIVGMLYGAVSGFVSGILMTMTTRWMFPNIGQQHLYKITMGILAFSTTLLIFVADFMWVGGYNAEIFSKTMPITDWIAVCLMSMVFAVYASQKTADEYLQETQPIPKKLRTRR